MIIRAAHEADAPAIGRVMVATYLATYRDQLPAEVWAKRAEEWTPEVPANGWACALREIATDGRPQDCIYVAVDDGGAIVGLAMGGPANAEELPQTGAVYALYISTEADADELAQMRWDFRLEDAPGATVHDQASFLQACAAFLR